MPASFAGPKRALEVAKKLMHMLHGDRCLREYGVHTELGGDQLGQVSWAPCYPCLKSAGVRSVSGTWQLASRSNTRNRGNERIVE